MVRKSLGNSPDRSREKHRSKKAKKPNKYKLKPISLNPLSLEKALQAVIATGPITDPEIKKRRK